MPDHESQSESLPASPPQDAASLAIEVILDRKGTDVLQLDISRCSDLADSMVICTVRSARQAQAVAHHLSERMKKAGFRKLSMPGIEAGSWIVLDYGDVVIHVMQEDVRRFYDLEALWADGEVVRRVAGDAADAGIDSDPDDPDALGDEDGREARPRWRARG